MFKYFKYELKKDALSLFVNLFMIFIIPIMMELGQKDFFKNYKETYFLLFGLATAYLMYFTYYRIIRIISKDLYSDTKYFVFTLGIKKSTILLTKYIYGVFNLILAQFFFAFGIFVIGMSKNFDIMGIFPAVLQSWYQLLFIVILDIMLVALSMMIYVLLRNLTSNFNKVRLISMIIYIILFSMFVMLVDSYFVIKLLKIENLLNLFLSFIFIMISIISIDKKYEV